MEENEVTIETVDNKEEDQLKVDKEQQLEEAIPLVPPRSCVVQELDYTLDGKH